MSTLKSAILIVAVILLCLPFYLHFSFIDEEMYSEHNPNTQHIQSLIHQTKSLLADVIEANLTLSKDAMSEISMHVLDKQSTQKEMKEILKELQHTEDGFARCINEKYEIHAELEKCQTHLKDSINILGDIQPPVPKIIDPLNCTRTLSFNNATSTSIKWLVIGIPTVARKNGEAYLLTTLEVVAKQLPSDPDDLLYGKILFLIMNAQKNTAAPDSDHKAFSEARKLYSAPNPLSIYFEFVDMTESDILPDLKGPNFNDLGNANVPGFLVRRQTRNIANVIKKSIGKGQYFLFLEDDMQFCPNGFLAIQYLLSKSSRYHPNWLAIRASYGMNGIFMHDKDLEVFSDYLIKNQVRRPPDHLVVEWYAGETHESKKYKGKRANIGFKYNLFHHIGVVSTLRDKKSGSFPICFEMLAEPTVFKVEAYNPAECPFEDIWPCNVPHKDKFTIDWSKQNHRT